LEVRVIRAQEVGQHLGVKRIILRPTLPKPIPGPVQRLGIHGIDHLHWIDGETQALLDNLVDSLGSARLLLLVNYRPEYQHGWGSKTAYSQMRLDALAAESAGELLEALLGDDPSLAPLKQLLIKRGNPFFLEETARSLVETKALDGSRGRYRLTQPLQAPQVPATVQTVLAARIDRLAPEDKRLLQTASVVGKDVPLALLQAIAELPDEALRAGLDHLRAAEFLYETGLFPDLEYTFKHALTHEVTYGSLLHTRRRDLHARIVEAIEALHRDRPGEQIERLAHHALRGELREKAVHYLWQAGRKAAARSAPQDARVWLEAAIGVLDALSDSPSTLEQAFTIRLELRRMLSQLGELRLSLGRLREAEALAERLDDDRLRSRAGAFGATVLTDLGELDEALVTGMRAQEIAERLGDVRLRILSGSFLVEAHYYRGEYARVVQLATENLAALPPDLAYEYFEMMAPPLTWNRLFLTLSLAQLGQFIEAGQYEAEAIQLDESTQPAFMVSGAYFFASTLHPLKGDWVKARALIEHWLSVVRAGKVVLHLSTAVAVSAWVLAQLGESSEALDRLREGEQLLEQEAARGVVFHRSWAYHSLGRACLLLGRLDLAQRFADRAVESCPGHRGFVAHAWHLLGDIATHPDRFDAETGEAHYGKALALAAPRGMRPLVAHCHFGLGKLYRRIGKREPAQEHLATATTMYREMGMAFWLTRTEAEMRGAT
jgi:tetratricopeptide (TPR) repeat protein